MGKYIIRSCKGTITTIRVIECCGSVQISTAPNGQYQFRTTLRACAYGPEKGDRLISYFIHISSKSSN